QPGPRPPEPGHCECGARSRGDQTLRGRSPSTMAVRAACLRSVTRWQEGAMCPFLHARRPFRRWPRLALAVGLLGRLAALPAASSGEHGGHLLGTPGLLGGAQAPEGIYYQNIFSYYDAATTGR